MGPLSYARRVFAGLGVIVILIAGVALAGGTDRGGADRSANFATPLVSAPSDAVASTVAEVQPPIHDHSSTSTVTPMAGATASSQAESTTTPLGGSTTSPTTPSTTAPSPVTTPSQAETSTTVAGATVVAGDVSMTNPIVNAGSSLVFEAATSATLHVRGNLTVLGTLVMHPNPDVTHRIVFEDRGELLVTESGVLDIQGTRTAAWNRTGSDPTWRASDELIVAPIAPGDFEYHPFTLGSPVPRFQEYRAEVANLTRNVVIDGPSRIMLHGLDGHAPQVIKFATIANAGVTDQVGMYALHFHLNGDATRGSIVEGVVVRDSLFRAFVPHGSNGITFRDTLAVNVVANGYWWDLNQAEELGAGNESDDIVYERAGVIGLRTSSPPDTNQSRQAGFNLGDGSGNVVRDSFVTGLASPADHAGFQWPEKADSSWTAQDLVSHNNRGHGFFVWQRGAEQHNVNEVDAYLNAGAGIGEGNYLNSFSWIGARLVANGEGLHLHAFSMLEPDPRQTFECVLITDSPVGVVVDFSPSNQAGEPTLFANLVMQRVTEEFAVTAEAVAAGQNLDTRVELVDYQTPC